MVFKRFPALLTMLALVGLSAWASPPASIRLEDSDTRVGITKVKLLVDDLVFIGDRLQGSYQIKVRFAPMLNDQGRVVLDRDAEVHELIAHGGELNGFASSAEDGRTHPVVCKFKPGGDVTITIDTGDRVLSFDSKMRTATRHASR